MYMYVYVPIALAVYFKIAVFVYAGNEEKWVLSRRAGLGLCKHLQLQLI